MNKILLIIATKIYYNFPFIRKYMMRAYRFFYPFKHNYPRKGEAPQLSWGNEYLNLDKDTHGKDKLPKIVAMYRIKNEERTIGYSLKSVSDVCDEIVILDNGSTDNTIEICKKFNKVVDLQVNPEAHLPMDDSKSKNLLLKMTLKRNPDYILSMDGDEILQPHAREIILHEIIDLYPNNYMFEFQLISIWDRPNSYRYDGVYGDFWNKRLIKMDGQTANLHFLGTEYPGNIHCPSIPINAKGWDKPIKSKVKILHYNVYDEITRKLKVEYFKKVDPNNTVYGEYQHLIGPYGKFSGPDGIEIRNIPEGFYYDIPLTPIRKDFT